MSEHRLRIQVWGKVQGVGFHAQARAEARHLGMHITAENLPDGSVLLQASGSPEQIAKFLEWAHRGPRHARVDRVEAAQIVPPDTISTGS